MYCNAFGFMPAFAILVQNVCRMVCGVITSGSGSFLQRCQCICKRIFHLIAGSLQTSKGGLCCPVFFHLVLFLAFRHAPFHDGKSLDTLITYYNTSKGSSKQTETAALISPIHPVSVVLCLPATCLLLVH